MSGGMRWNTSAAGGATSPREPRGGTLTHQVKAPVQMGGGGHLSMDRDDVGASLGEVGDTQVGLHNHLGSSLVRLS